jgi:predicted GTPase
MGIFSITGIEARDQAANWATTLADKIKSHDTEASVAITEAVRQFRTANFQIAVLGKAKRGKSTLINALLGRRDDLVAPIDKLPASSTITRLHWGPEESATVSFRGGRTERIGYSQIRDFVTEESNPENRREVELVDVTGPFVGIDHDLTLVDTPGAGSIHEYHDALLHAFIPQADAVIFLVSARMPIDQDELELLTKVKAADIRKVFFVMNRIDEMSDSDIADAVHHNQSLLSQAGIAVKTVYKISAKRAYQGDFAGSNLEMLCTDLRQFLTENKASVLRERFISRVIALASPALGTMDVEASAFRRSTDDLSSELKTLMDKKRGIETERTLAEREFNLGWTNAVDQFAHGLQFAKATTLSEVANYIGGASLTEVSKVARDLPGTINRILEERLESNTHTFESAARDATSKLQATYPALIIGETGSITVKTKTGSEVIAGSVGGIATAATGVGLAAAGSAVAGGIAAANAAAIATTASVAAPSLVSGLLTMAGLPWLAPLATGTATVAAPTALTMTPLWVALAGPVGWTLAGVGILAIPFSWRVSKIRQRDKLEDAAKEQINSLFSRLKSERIQALRNAAKTIVEEFQIRLDRELSKIEVSLINARDHRPDANAITQIDGSARELRSILAKPPGGDA